MGKLRGQVGPSVQGAPRNSGLQLPLDIFERASGSLATS